MMAAVTKMQTGGRRGTAKWLMVALSLGMATAGLAMAADAGQDGMHAMHGMEHDMHAMHSMHDHHMGPMQHGITARSMATYHIPDVKLVDPERTEVALRDELDGRLPVILNFAFTSCTAICPVTTATFQQVQEQLGPKRDKVRLVTISIDPENDTPGRLKEYASKYHAGAHWKMLTGTVTDSIAVQQAFGVYSGDKMNHKPITFLRPAGADQQWVRLDGFASAADIINELDHLMAH